MTGKKLIAGMEAAELTCEDLAAILFVSVDTIKGWRSRPDANPCCGYMSREVEKIIRRRSLRKAVAYSNAVTKTGCLTPK